MANGSSYPVYITDANGHETLGQTVQFTDSTNQPQAGSNAVTSGTIGNAGAWVSGTAKVNPVAYQVTMYVELVGDATNAIATCTVALSPDNSTFTTVGTPSLAAAVNNTGAITLLVPVVIPNGWYIKLTFSHFTVAASKYV